MYGVIDHYFSDWSRLTQDLVSARAVKMIRFSSTPARAIYDVKKKKSLWDNKRMIRAKNHVIILHKLTRKRMRDGGKNSLRIFPLQLATCRSALHRLLHILQGVSSSSFSSLLLFFSSGLIIAFTILMKYSWANQRLQHGLDWINPQLSSPRSESTTAQAKGKKTPPTAYINTRLHAMQ